MVDGRDVELSRAVVGHRSIWDGSTRSGDFPATGGGTDIDPPTIRDNYGPHDRKTWTTYTGCAPRTGGWIRTGSGFLLPPTHYRTGPHLCIARLPFYCLPRRGMTTGFVLDGSPQFVHHHSQTGRPVIPTYGLDMRFT